MLALANRLGKETISVPERLNTLQINLEADINSLENLETVRNFKNNLAGNSHIVTFFSKSSPNKNNSSINNCSQNSNYQTISTRV